MVTVHELVDAETNSAYDSADAINAIERAYYELSALLDDTDLISVSTGSVGNTNLELTNNNERIAVTKLSVNILVNARQHEKSKAQNVTPISMEKMITDEIRHLLLVGDETDSDDTDEGVMWSNAQPIDSWDSSGVRL